MTWQCTIGGRNWAWAFGPASSAHLIRKQIQRHVFDNRGDRSVEKLFEQLERSRRAAPAWVADTNTAGYRHGIAYSLSYCAAILLPL
jgi:hypothetical protein